MPRQGNIYLPIDNQSKNSLSNMWILPSLPGFQEVTFKMIDFKINFPLLYNFGGILNIYVQLIDEYACKKPIYCVPAHVSIYMNIDREVEKIFMQILGIYLVRYFGIFQAFMKIV